MTDDRENTWLEEDSGFLARRVLPLYAALAVGVLGRSLGDPGRFVVGHPDSDIWKHLWHHWLVREGLASGQVGCYRLSSINAPHGATLYDIDIVNNLLALPVSVLSIPWAVNLLVAVHLVGGALAGYFLARYVTRNPTTALVAGAVYGFSPYVLLHPVASGVHERLHLTLPALAILFLLEFLEEGRWRHLVLSGLVMPVLVFASPSYTMFVVLMAGILAVLETGVFVLTPWGRGAPRAVRLARWILVAGTWAVCAAPAAYAVRACARAEARSGGGSGGDPAALALFSPARSVLEIAGKAEALPLECFFDPSSLPRCVSPDGDFLYRFPYVGYAVFLLGGIGLMFSRSRWSRLLVVTGIVLLVLAFGPAWRFRWGASSYRVFVPSALLLKYLPFYHRVHVWQQVVLVGLLFAVGGADALARLAPSRQALLTGVTMAVVLGEVLWVCREQLPLPVTDTRIPAVYDRLATLDAGSTNRHGLVLDLPSHAQDPRVGGGRYLWYQTRHQRPVPYTINDGPVNTDPLIRYIEGKGATAREAGVALVRWREVGVRYVVVHRLHSSPAELERAVAVLNRGGAVLLYEDPTHLLFGLPRPAPENTW